MKNIKVIFKSPLLYIILSGLAFSLFSWLAGPYIHIGQYDLSKNRPLQQAPMAVFILLLSNYLLIKLVLRHKPFHSHTPSSPQPNENLLEQTVLTDLKHNCLHVIRHCKQPRPWFLLIGPAGSGKTALLTHMPFKLNATQQTMLNYAKSTQWIDWWTSDQAVFIDPAGKYALPQSDELAEQFVWRGLLKVLKKYRRRALVRGVLLVVDVGTLSHINQATFNDLVENLIHQLQLLKSLQAPLSIYLIISQSDRISGFTEFFDDLSQHERKQPLGFRIHNVQPRDLPEQVEKKFDEFVLQLSARSLWRLHHESSLLKRGRIQQFPLQLEKLGQRLKTIIAQLPWNHYLQLHGLYFVSSFQQHTAIDLLHTLPVSQTFGLQSQLPAFKQPEHHAYFINHLLKSIAVDGYNQFHQNPFIKRRQLLAYLSAITLIGGLTLCWHHSYQHNVNTIDQIMVSLRTPTPVNATALALPWLNRLNTLIQTITTLKQDQDRLDTFSGLNQHQRFLQSTRECYHQLLRTSFMPYLIENVTMVIEQSRHHDEVALYNALKIYLMLTENKHVDPTLIRVWFDQYWQQQLTDKQTLQTQLHQHLNELLTLPNLSWPTNEVLIDQAQNELRELPLVNRAFLKLQENYPLENVPILADLPKFEGVDLNHATVCSFCTTTHFQTIYAQQIPATVHHLLAENWVLATPARADLSLSQQKRLIEKLRLRYIDYYRQQWAQALPNIQLSSPQTLSQARHTVKMLQNPHSSFWKLLHIVYDNATLNQYGEPTITPPAVKALQQIFASDHYFYQETHASLLGLQDYLTRINAMSGIDQASYLAAIARFQQNSDNDPISHLLLQAQQEPAVVQPWLQTAASGAWHAILVNARQYLNTIWSTTVIPDYQQHIAHRYPIFRKANDDISLASFTQFFGPSGALGHFFNQYLKPFVNMEQNYWTFKVLENESINIPQHTLDMLIRASMIQQMFFTDNHAQPLINFTLTPVRLGANTNAFTLNLGGQIIQFSPDQLNGQDLHWPTDGAFFATMLFTGADNHSSDITTSGPWALFRLFDRLPIQITKNAHAYHVKFKLQNHSAEYLLIANHLINPFIPGILSKFRCPSQL